jgi:Tol biopolymer transport system component
MYVDWSNGGSLVLHDIASNAVRYVKRGDNKNFAESPAFTPDGSHIVYEWYVEATKNYELRIIGIDGSGERTVLRNQSFVLPAAVTPDSRFAAAEFGAPNKSQLALISLDTGEVRILEDSSPSTIGNFSADGRWLVYVGRVSGPFSDAEVHVISTSGSPDTVVTPGLKISGQPFFTPDGSRVVFIAAHDSRQDLWAVRMQDGKPLGEPELVKGGVCQRCDGLGFSRDGTYYFDENISQGGIFVAQLDPGSWKVVGSPKRVSDQFLDPQPNSPGWSPDGKLLAYLPGGAPSANMGPGEVKFVIRGADSARKEVAVHYEQVQRAQNYRWLPDGKSLLLNGPPVPRLLDLETGKESNLLDLPAGGASVSPDGRFMFYALSDGDVFKPTPSSTPRIVRRDIAAGDEKELYRAQGPVSYLALSPDGQYLMFTVATGTPPQKLMVAPTAGGEARELPHPGRFGLMGITWAPDSKALVLLRRPEQARGSSEVREILLLPIDGGPLRETGATLDGAINSISLSPDGRIAYAAMKSSSEVWVIKNLFPASR